TTIVITGSATNAAAKARTPAPSAPSPVTGPIAPAAHAASPTIPAGAITMPPLQLTLTPSLPAQPTYRQGVPPPSPAATVSPPLDPPFPLPWNVSGDLR